MTDAEGRRYLDLLSAYSALNFGHRHPRLVAAAHAQLDRLTLTSRAFHNDQLGPVLRGAGRARRPRRGDPHEHRGRGGRERHQGGAPVGVRRQGRAGRPGHDHHRRRTASTAAPPRSSGSPPTRRRQRGFGPFTPGFRSVPFGDVEAVEAAIDATTAAVLLEPVQGEAGVIVPPAGLPAGGARALRPPRRAAHRRRDPVRASGAPGRTLACDHERRAARRRAARQGARAAASCRSRRWSARREVIDTLEPGSHGSTFGGNPLACAIAREVIDMMRDAASPSSWPATLGVAPRRLDVLDAGHGHDEPGRHRGPHHRPVGRHRPGAGSRHRPGRQRAAAAPRRAGEGHAATPHAARRAAAHHLARPTSTWRSTGSWRRWAALG